MSDPEDFLTRWSRRKQAAAQQAEQEASTASPPPENSDPACVTQSEPHAAPFDLADLPPIESIGPDTDLRGFLAPGVPAELTRAALRRAWSADPKIRDFIGLSENAWDFNAPEGLPGFGPLELTEEMRRQILAMVGRSLGPQPASTEDMATTAGCTGAGASAVTPARVEPMAADPELVPAPPPERGAVCDRAAHEEEGGTLPLPACRPTSRDERGDAKMPESAISPVRKRRHGRALPE